MKRAFDITISLLSILILLIPGLVIMLILRLTGEGKVFYLQPRVGQDRQLFKVYKFVTMWEDSESKGTGVITIKNDPRVLPFGRILRKTKINELPQLLNVFKGDMSMVGPRPLTPVGFDFFPDDIQPQIAELKPGLTGIGSIVFRNEEDVLAASTKSLRDCYIEDIAPHKGKLELWYKENGSVWVDIKILMLTAWVVLFGDSRLYQRCFTGLPE